MPPEPLFDLHSIDLNTVVADVEAIRKINPQRHEMEQLTAIVKLDHTEGLIAGYKDVRADEFWVRGHMPGYPLMPGVMICEAAAQLAAYYMCTLDTLAGDFLAFTGLENVKFRGPVKPGDRLVLIGKSIRITKRSMHSRVQGFVNRSMVFEGDVLGMPYAKKGG
jgi:3-hydroxyacyl-[acyl-carrier-protein] dehydratase